MNKFMNEHLKKLNNENENLENIKLKMQKHKQKRKILINAVAVFLVVILLGTASPKLYAKFQQNMKYKEYTRRNYVSGKGEIASAYNEKIDMEYVFQNDIGVKIDSIILTDDTFKANINLKLPDELRVDKLPENNNEDTSIHFGFGFAVYDEKNNVLAINTRLDNSIFGRECCSDYIRCLYKELGIKNELFSEDLANSVGGKLIEKNDDIIIQELELNSLKGFPNSEKIYIRIFNIGYNLSKVNEDKMPFFSEHSDLEWQFEIDTPDKFLKRETIKLILLDEIPRLNINKFVLTETGMVLEAKKKDVVETMGAGKDMDNWGEVSDALINITDEQGNIYYPVQGGTTGKKNEFYSRFEIDKDLFESTTLYLNMKIGDEEYTSEISKFHK